MAEYRVVRPDGTEETVDDAGLKRLSSDRAITLSGGPVVQDQEYHAGDLGKVPIQGALGTILKTGVPIVGGLGATAALGPEAGIPAKMGLQALMSLLSGGVQRAVDKEPQTLGGAATDLAIGAGSEGAVAAGGSLLRTLLGKGAAVTAATEAGSAMAKRRAIEEAKASTGALVERDKAIEGAVSKNVGQRDKAREGVRVAKQGLNAQEDLAYATSSEKAFHGLKDEVVEKHVNESLGGLYPAEALTLEDLAKQTSAIQHPVQRQVGSVFKGLSQKFTDTLAPFAENPVRPSFGSAVMAQKEMLTSEGKAMSPTLQTKLKKLGGQVSSEMNVQQYDGIRHQLVDFMIGSKNPTDRRVVGRILSSVNSDFDQAMPDSAKAVMTELRDQWRQANSTYSNAFRSRLFRATSPGEVAQVLASGKPERAAQVIRQMKQEAPDELPLLRQAFSDHIMSSGNTLKSMEEMNPTVFKELYAGSGFDSPKGWIEALRGQVRLEQIQQDPKLAAKFALAVKQGMKSTGVKNAEAALKVAEDRVRAVPDLPNAIRESIRDTLGPEESALRSTQALPTAEDAGRAAGMEAMKEPLIGKGFQSYVKHRTVYHAVIGGLLLGGSHYVGNPALIAVPLTYMASSSAIGMALSNPKLGRMYYNAITSKTAEQAGFYFGRLAASTLSELGRESAGD